MRRRTGGSGRAASVALLVALQAIACTGAGEDGPRAVEMQGAGARVGGAVISTVDGSAITVSDVQDLVDHSGLPPDEALRRLQAERLLMTEAARRDFGRAGAVDQVARQARVQALLDAATARASVSDEEIQAAYQKAKARFERPELRIVVHVLASLPKEPTAQAEAAARAFIADAIAQLARVTDVKAFVSSMRRLKTPHFGVTSESLPPVARGGNLVPAFLDAVFALAEPGVVPEPVRTRFGWHAIRVLQIQPPFTTPYAEAAEQLRAELLVARKKQIVDELIADARKRHRVELSGDLRAMLAKLEF